MTPKMSRLVVRLLTFTAISSLVGLSPSLLSAQPMWSIVADDGRTSAVQFVEMDPGWHITSRTDALVYQPDQLLDGSFRVEYEAHAFPGAISAAGIFFGGSGFVPGASDYFEVLIDSQGRYRVGHRTGREYNALVPWTASEAIRVPTDQAALNTLAVAVSPRTVVLTINGQEVTSFAPPEGARLDGIGGLRITSGLNVHVTRLEFEDTEPRAAP